MICVRVLARKRLGKSAGADLHGVGLRCVGYPILLRSSAPNDVEIPMLQPALSGDAAAAYARMVTVINEAVIASASDV